MTITLVIYSIIIIKFVNFKLNTWLHEQFRDIAMIYM